MGSGAAPACEIETALRDVCLGDDKLVHKASITLATAVPAKRRRVRFADPPTSATASVPMNTPPGDADTRKASENAARGLSPALNFMAWCSSPVTAKSARRAWAHAFEASLAPQEFLRGLAPVLSLAHFNALVRAHQAFHDLSAPAVKVGRGRGPHRALRQGRAARLRPRRCARSLDLDGMGAGLASTFADLPAAASPGNKAAGRSTAEAPDMVRVPPRGKCGVHEAAAPVTCCAARQRQLRCDDEDEDDLIPGPDAYWEEAIRRYQLTRGVARDGSPPRGVGALE